MSMQSIWVLTSICTLLILLRVYVKSRRRLNLLNSLPGPPPLPFVGNTLMFITPRENLLPTFARLRDKYGDIYRTWHGRREAVHLFAPEYIEAILGANNKHIRKGNAYRFLVPWLGRGLITSSGQTWFSHRKLITPTFHFKILEGFVDVFNECSQVLVHKLKEQCGTSSYFDIGPYITRCTLDIICETAMGTKINAQENENSPFLAATLGVSEIIVKRQFTIWLHPDTVFYSTLEGRKFKKYLSVLHQFAEKVINERRLARRYVEDDSASDTVGLKKRMAFLDLLLESAEKQSVALTDKEIREEVDTFSFAGHDTTTASISWTLLLLGNHPEIQNAVRAELDELFHGEDRPATLRDLKEMKLLERVIKEALRLYPSVTMIARRLDEDMVFGKYTVPSGSNVIIHVLNTHRHPRLYPNPNKFDPDRFLPQNSQKRHPYAYIPFSAGQRNCIGQKFAMHEEKVVISTILRNFSIISQHKPEEVPNVHELVGRPKAGVFVKLEPLR